MSDGNENQDVAALIAAAKAGSTDALGHLSEAYREYLLAVSASKLPADLRAKVACSDVVQETFIGMQRDIGSFRGTTEAEFTGWLTRTLSNRIAAFGRRFRNSRKRMLSQEVAIDVTDSGLTPHWLATGDSQTPSRCAIATEEASRLAQALKRLPDEYQQVIYLRNVQLWPFDEIGKAMGRSANAACQFWTRAVDRLAREMKRSHAPKPR